MCSGAFRQNGQASSADDSALRGTGEEEGHGGGGLQDRPEAAQTEVQRCRKTTAKGKNKLLFVSGFPLLNFSTQLFFIHINRSQIKIIEIVHQWSPPAADIIYCAYESVFSGDSGYWAKSGLGHSARGTPDQHQNKEGSE